MNETESNYASTYYKFSHYPFIKSFIYQAILDFCKSLNRFHGNSSVADCVISKSELFNESSLAKNSDSRRCIKHSITSSSGVRSCAPS